MCEYCEVIDEYKHGRGEQEDGIFYDSKFNKYYLVIEEFRYERTEKEINFCPICGRNLRQPQTNTIANKSMSEIIGD